MLNKPIVTDIFIRGRKLNISLVFITQSYFSMPKDIRLNSTHCFVMKVPNKQNLQKTAFLNSSDINFKDFMNLYKKCTAKSCFFVVVVVINPTLASGNHLWFRKNLRKNIKTNHDNWW